MVKEALILCNLPFTGSDHDIQKPPAKLLGLSFIKRAVLTAHSAGIESVLLVCRAGDTERLEKLSGSEDICKLKITVCPVPLHQLKERLGRKGDSHFLLFSDSMVFPHRLLQELLKNQLQNNENLMMITRPEDLRDGSWQGLPLDLTEDGREILRISSNTERPGGYGCGPALIAARGLAKLILSLQKSYSHAGLEDFFQQWLTAETCHAQEVYPYFCLVVKDKKSYKTARRLLLNSTRKETDGVVSRYINRYISLLISRVALALGISASQITVANLVIGLVAAIFLAMGGYLNTAVGGVIFQVTSVLDGSDGEVAKLSFRASRSGAWLDTFCDQTITLAVFIGLSVGLYRASDNSLYIWLGTISVISVAALQLLLDLYVKKARGSGSTVKIVKDIETEGHRPRKPGQTTVQRIISLLFSRIGFLVRRDVFAMLFMVLCFLSWQEFFLWGLVVITPGAAIYVLILYLRKN